MKRMVNSGSLVKMKAATLTFAAATSRNSSGTVAPRRRKPQRREQRADGRERGVDDAGGGNDAAAGRVGRARLDEGGQGHDVHAAEEAGQEERGKRPQASVAGEERRCTARRQGGARHGGGREVGLDRGGADAERGDRHEADLDPASGQALAGERPGANAERERGQRRRAAAGEIGNLREADARDEPEPRLAENREEHLPVRTGERERLQRRADGVPVDPQFRRAGRGDGDAAAREPAGDGRRKRGREQPSRGPVHAGDCRAGEGPEQDRCERARPEHGVAADQFRLVHVLRRDREPQRREERRPQAEQEQRREQQRQAVEVEGRAGEASEADLAGLDEPDQARLLAPVGELSGGGGEQEDRQREERRGGVEREVRALLRGETAPEEQDGQRGLELMVVEGAEELGREQGR